MNISECCYCCCFEEMIEWNDISCDDCLSGLNMEEWRNERVLSLDNSNERGVEN